MSETTARQETILIVDDTPTNLGFLVDFLAQAGFEVSVATSGETALKQLQHEQPDLILLDVMMPGIDGFETCRRLKAKETTRHIPVIFMTALTDTADKVRGFADGGVDYVTKPLQQEEVLARVRTHLKMRQLQRILEGQNEQLENEVEARQQAQFALQEANEGLEQRVVERTAALAESNAALQAALAEVEVLKNRLQAENVYLREEIHREHNFEEIISSSSALAKVLREVEQVAATEATVLILGETGTGKELLARAVHQRSQRAERPLVKVNCAALPENLIESELFGHEKGAFTGAIERRIGRFELADGGTLFLDEIGDLPLALQAKLLRVLQEGELERLGSARTIKVDVRIIAATNRDLQEAIARQEFREDLYYRLHVFPLHSPPLRERLEDIPLLVDHFVGHYAAKTARQIDGVPQQAMQALQAYDWPGNVRELENIIERAVIVTTGGQLELGDWLPKRRSAGSSAEPTLMEEVERTHILKILKRTGWKVSGQMGAADVLGLKRTTLEARMRKLGIERPQ